MTSKYTPEEQAALDALRGYSEWMGFSPEQYAARQSIIRAFQDRARLLAVLEGILIWDDLPGDMLASVRAAITQTKRTA